jgi:S-adenosylmethionine-dependent methyltransferase
MVLRSLIERGRVSSSIRRNWRPPLTAADEKVLLDEIVNIYFSHSIAAQLVTNDGLTDEGRISLDDHLYLRLTNARITIVPWIASIMSLQRATVLEIGCGTGSSTVAIAEQAARVVGVDIDEGSLKVAKTRCRLYGIDRVEFYQVNANEVGSPLIEAADIVVYFSCLEHMTLDEKLSSISRTWYSLKSGAYLAVIETPNRLWWKDFHSSFLPFFTWLPDDLAIHYAKFSPRTKLYHNVQLPVRDDQLLTMTRLGRAFSYHEMQLAIPELAELRTWSMHQWMRRRNPIEFARWIGTGDASFERQLIRRGPKLNSAYYMKLLNLLVQKP